MTIVDSVALQRFSSAHCFGIAAVAGVGIEDARVGDVVDVRQKDFRLHSAAAVST